MVVDAAARRQGAGGHRGCTIERREDTATIVFQHNAGRIDCQADGENRSAQGNLYKTC